MAVSNLTAMASATVQFANPKMKDNPPVEEQIIRVWDKANAVQTVTTSATTVDEIQSIEVNARRIPEVQQIETSAIKRSEVQAISTACDDAIGGTFLIISALKLRKICPLTPPRKESGSPLRLWQPSVRIASL